MIQRPSIEYQKILSVMGEQLLFQTNHLPFLETAERAFGLFPTARQKTLPPLVLQLFIHSPEKDTTLSQPTLAAHSHGHLLTLSADQHNHVTADLKHGYAFGYLTPSLAENLEFVRYSFIEAAVQAMLGLSRGFVAIHAAAVIKNGTCLLLSAPSGTGKSTLTYACLRQGYKLLAEDVVQVNLSGDKLQLWGMPWKCHLMADSLQYFPELQGKKERLLVNGKSKVPIKLAQLYPQSMETNSQNGRLVFLVKSQEGVPARLTPLSPAETRNQFEAIWSWETGWQEQYDRHLGDLISPGGYQLQLGHTPNESIQALKQIFQHS